jgi:hypothetical protein
MLASAAAPALAKLGVMRGGAGWRHGQPGNNIHDRQYRGAGGLS